ncbi:MAG TPA: SIS domain-containing protein, partial [Acidimicrobiales bacterium]
MPCDRWDQQCDVLVVGSRGGALAGALSAATAGLRVVVIGKTELFGGTTAYSGGGLWIPLNPANTRAGGGGLRDLVERYLDATVGPDRRELRDAYLAAGPGVIAELEHAGGISHIPCWFVVDQAHVDRYGFATNRPGRDIKPEWFDSGAVVQAASLGELAGAIGVPGAALGARSTSSTSSLTAASTSSSTGASPPSTASSATPAASRTRIWARWRHPPSTPGRCCRPTWVPRVGSAATARPGLCDRTGRSCPDCTPRATPWRRGPTTATRVTDRVRAGVRGAGRAGHARRVTSFDHHFGIYRSTSMAATGPAAPHQHQHRAAESRRPSQQGAGDRCRGGGPRAPVALAPMCGIVAVLGQPSTRPAPDPDAILAGLDQAAGLLAGDDLAGLTPALAMLEGIDRSLRGTPGLRALLGRPGTVDEVAARTAGIEADLVRLEDQLDSGVLDLPPSRQEAVNATLVALKDAWWAIDRDRVGAARAVQGLMPEDTPPDALDGWWSIQVALASLDRLEVRGRDSAGIHVLVAGAGIEGDDRAPDPLFTSGAVRAPEGCLSLVYKAAAEIGELGDNVKALRAAIRADGLLARVLAAPGARTTVVGHTRWASVGIISEANAHPLNSEEEGDSAGPYVVAALNGDVDNHTELRQTEGLRLPPEITTDAKVIPTIVARRLGEGAGLADAFRATVARFEGSVAIAAASAVAPDELHLALCGSGQSLYIGLAEDAFVVASEPYGLVEETSRYVRMDGEATQGQVVCLGREGAGSLAAMARARYDGGPLPLEQREVITAEITTRDIDRAGFHHFLLKELTEAPNSFRKTLRGRIVAAADGRLAVRVGEDTVPPALAAALRDGRVRRVLVIGQGTAAVAGQAVAAAIARCLPGLAVAALPATELSGFGLADDMSDTLVVAISQSGTTTDTNRTVDLVRTRGAHVVAVVNRRNSDLAAKSHGVLHTSDGRDVEMSVASTKAFYAQVAAGWLLAGALAQAAGHPTAAGVDEVLRALRELPAAMEKVLARREEIGRIAASVAPSRRYWAVVGSGPDRIAAAEVRIKLSELCYRSISSDATEDKKHIDLSCEPLILVCAAGLRGPNADDVAKEIAIYRAHKAAPVVVATEGEAERFQASAWDVITVPVTDPSLAFVLSAMVGHLFGYEAALSIDAQARPLREARAAIEAVVSAGPDDLVDRLRPDVHRVIQPFLQGLREGGYNGNLEAATAVRLVSLLRYATGVLPLEGYELESGKIGVPSALVADLLEA